MEATVVDTYSNIDGEETHQQAMQGIYDQMYSDIIKNNGSSVKRIGDVFSNPSLDLGVGTTDPTMEGLYPQARTLTWNLMRIESVMRADPFFTRALEWRAAAPLMNGIDISSDKIEPKEIESFKKKLRKKLFPAVREHFFETDAFGWSGLLILIDGQMNPGKLKTPLNPKDIKKGKLLGVKPLTRWYQINPNHQKLITRVGKDGIDDPRLLGTPLYYNVSFDGDRANYMEVHRSRLIITPRNRLSYIEKKVEHYGGTSLLEQCFESLTRYHSLIAQVHRILQKTVIPILQMEGMGISGLQNSAALKELERKIEMIRQNLSSHNMLVIGDEDKLEFVEAQLNNIDGMIKEAKIQLSASMNTPRSELFLEEGGEEDIKYYYSFIRERQEFQLEPLFDALIPLYYLSEYGEEMPDYTLKFKPLENPSSKEMAEARKMNVETLDILYKSDVYDLKSYQDTLADIDNNPTDIFRNLTEDYRKYIEKEGTVTHSQRQVELAMALNKAEGDMSREKIEGKVSGGNPKNTKKPTPDLNIKPDKPKEG